MEAESERAVARRLLHLGYHPCSISERTAEAGRVGILARLRHGRVDTRDLAVFTRQFAELVDAGMPVGVCLANIAEQTENPLLSDALLRVESQVQGGAGLADSLAKQGETFPGLVCAMVRAGEEGGMLSTALMRLADHYERDDELRGQVKGALAYPVFLVLVGAATVFVLMTFVVPKFVSLFRGFGQQLPLPTRMLIAVSLFLGSYWWILLLGVAGALVLLRQAAKTQEGKGLLDRLRISLPFWGPVLRKLEVARFAATLGSLLEGGVPILQSLDISAQTVRNVHIRAPIESAKDVVREGGELAASLASSPDFPALVANLLAIGQATGNLPSMLHKVASIYQRETDRTIRTMTALLEPMLIFVLGGVVALVVAGILLPIFRMNVLVQ